MPENKSVEFIITGPVEGVNICNVCEEIYEAGNYVCYVRINGKHIYGLGYLEDKQPSHCGEKKVSGRALFVDVVTAASYVKKIELAYEKAKPETSILEVIPLVDIPEEEIQRAFVSIGSSPLIPVQKIKVL